MALEEIDTVFGKEAAGRLSDENLEAERVDEKKDRFEVENASESGD